MRLPPLLVALLLAAPIAAAHLPHRRGGIQAGEGERAISIERAGTAAFVNLTLLADIERDTVEHVVDPARGMVQVSYRASPPDSASAFEQTWTIDRVLEYHDANIDGRFEPGTDGTVKSWRLTNYAWTGPTVTNATIAKIPVADIAWVGRLEGGPNVTLEMVVAGKPVTDEGANARAQDALLYFTFSAFPKRALGDLFVIETTLTTPTGASVVEERTTNLTTDLAVLQGNRAGFIDWGATALLDGVEGNVQVRVGEPVAGDATDARSVQLDLPRFDRTLHLVVVSAVEYDNSALQKTPGFELAGAAAALVIVALARRR